MAQTQVNGLEFEARAGSRRLMSLDEAVDRIWSLPSTPQAEAVRLDGALLRILAEDLTATAPIPGYDNAAMDGYALRVDEVPEDRCMKVSGRIAAGHAARGPVEPGTVVRIFTGAVIPAGANAVVMQENCEALADGRIRIKQLPATGTNIRLAGEDVAKGTTILRRGTRLRPQEIGMAASLGHSHLQVYRKVRVAVVATGDELRSPGEPLEFGTLYDSNRHALIAGLQGLGAEVSDYGRVRDVQAAVRDVLKLAASENDLVISSGGVSEGEEDHVRAAVEETGHLNFWKLALKPGKPVAVGAIDGVPFIGTPGNPVSALMVFWLLARPMVLRLMGARRIDTPHYTARAAFHFRRNPGRREFLRVRGVCNSNGAIQLELYPTNSSGAGSSLVWADGLAEISEDRATIQPGDLLPYIPFAELMH